jgi:hypothetical protein
VSYGHAPLLADGGSDPIEEMRRALRILGKWAALNPPLHEVFQDLTACLVRFEYLREKEGSST